MKKNKIEEKYNMSVTKKSFLDFINILLICSIATLFVLLIISDFTFIEVTFIMYIIGLIYIFYLLYSFSNSFSYMAYFDLCLIFLVNFYYNVITIFINLYITGLVVHYQIACFSFIYIIFFFLNIILNYILDFDILLDKYLKLRPDVE